MRYITVITLTIFCISNANAGNPIFHIGDYQVTFSTTRQTSPSLAANINGNVYYINMVSDDCSPAKLTHEDITYSLCNRYTPIQYIESTGTQYLDTELVINKTDSAEMILDATGQEYGSMKWTGANAYLQLRLEKGGWSILQNDTVTPFTARDNVRITYENDTETLYINNVLIQSQNWNFISANNANIMIFRLGAYNNGGASGFGIPKMKLYSFQLSLNGTTVRNMIPVLDEDNTPCMFDTISGKFFYNLGSGQFLYE